MADLEKPLSKLENQERIFLLGLMEGMTDEQAQRFLAAYRKKRKRPVTILLTALLGFVGLAGINRFLVGQKVLGVIYLFTLGFVWIGTIIDCLTYKRIAFKYNQEQARLVAFPIKSGLDEFLGGLDEFLDLRKPNRQQIAQIKQIFTYVIEVLDRFGKQKWGSKKKRNYRIYSDKDFSSLYSWQIVSDDSEPAGKQEVYDIKKGKVRIEQIYKHPGYEVTLVLGVGFMISYGGYKEYFFDGETIIGYELEKHIMLEEDEVSEAALQKTFAEILSKDFEPMAITSDDLKIAKRVV